MATYESDSETAESTEERARLAIEREERFRAKKAEASAPDARMDQGSNEESRAAEHATEMAEFEAWRRSRMDPVELRAMELSERYGRYDFDNAASDFWDQLARELIRGEEYHEIARSFKKVTAIFEALRANLDTFNRKIKHAFEEDANGEEE